jgi:HlyD family secretion protein
MLKKLIILVVVVGIATGGALAMRARARAKAKPQIETAQVERGDVTNVVSATGTLQPLTTVDIKSKAGGRVDVLAVEVGTVVKPGQLIAKIDPTDTLETVRTARADVDASHARVKQAQDNLRLQQLQYETAVRQAKEQLRSAQVRLAQAQRQAAIQPKLTDSSIAQAKASYEAAVEALRQLEKATLPQAKAAAESAYEQADSALKAAEEDLRMLKEATLPQGRAQALSALNQAKTNVEVAKKEWERQQDLRQRGYVAQSAVESAKNRYEVAVAQLDAAQKKWDTLEAEHSSDLRSAEHRVAQARASRASAKQKLETLAAEQSAELAAARARVAQAKAQWENAQANRIQDTLKQDDVAAARAAVQQAQAALAQAQANAIQVQVRAADIATARATVASSAARLQNAETQFEQTVITAPRAGVVLQKYVEQGTIISSGVSAFSEGTSIVQLGDISRMFVEVLVDEADIGSVDIDQQVDIVVDAYPDELFEGKVTRIDPRAETTQNVTTIKVTVEVDNPDARLKPGMNASCDFVVERAENVLVVPAEAVKEDERGGAMVTVLQGEQQIPRKVVTGISSGEVTEIKSGLTEGELVVTAVIDPQAMGQGQSQFRGPGGPMGGMPRGMRGGRR